MLWESIKEKQPGEWNYLIYVLFKKKKKPLLTGIWSRSGTIWRNKGRDHDSWGWGNRWQWRRRGAQESELDFRARFNSRLAQEGQACFSQADLLAISTLFIRCRVSFQKHHKCLPLLLLFSLVFNFVDQNWLEAKSLFLKYCYPHALRLWKRNLFSSGSGVEHEAFCASMKHTKSYVLS